MEFPTKEALKTNRNKQAKNLRKYETKNGLLSSTIRNNDLSLLIDSVTQGVNPGKIFKDNSTTTVRIPVSPNSASTDKEKSTLNLHVNLTRISNRNDELSTTPERMNPTLINELVSLEIP